MTIDEYNRLYPEERVWTTLATAVLAEGMLQFSPETAVWFAGPFEGGYAYFRLMDNRLRSHQPLLSMTEAVLQHRYAAYLLPSRLGYRQPATSEEQLQKRLSLLTAKERKAWDERVNTDVLDFPTAETPVSLFLAGNDDASYTKFFGSAEAGKEELELLLACQPLDFRRDLHGYVFTN